MDFQHELIIPDEGMPFKLFRFEGSGGSYVRERHWHTPIEIFAVMEGELRFILREEEILLRAGNFLIINSNEVHAIRAMEENYTAVLQIPLEQFERYYTADRYIRFCEGEQKNRALLFARIQKLFEVYQKRETGWEYRSLAQYHEVLADLVTSFRVEEVGESELRKSRRLDDLSRITSYMKAHYREELSLSGLAQHFGYSDAYLSRMFRKYAQVNFKTYLQDLRTTYAYRDLVNTDLTISQVALKNGFCSSRGFTNDFRRRYGLLPSEVRRKRREGSEE